MNRHRIYFIASAEGLQTTDAYGVIMTRASETIWLAEDCGREGFSGWLDGAKKFETVEEIVAQANRTKSGPWYYVMKPGTLKIYKIEERFTRTESPVRLPEGLT